MKRTRRSSTSGQKRGRPHKFGRRSELVAVTLPEDTVRRLRAIDTDLGWAIVQLAEGRGESAGSSAGTAEEAAARPLMELVRLPGNQGLILVQTDQMEDIEGVSVIPLTDGRAFLAFSGGEGISGLELAILDRMESLPARSAARATCSAMREQLRAWRRDPNLRFRNKSIIVVEGAPPNSPRRLPGIDTGG